MYVSDNLGVMSVGFLLPNPDEAVVWRVRVDQSTAPYLGSFG